ncbi:MAG: hypothetical protein IJO46_12110, partial [Thermoguttaceae bacterium]|nr:hypothetical protein [Thermoguttaceae bacterium]
MEKIEARALIFGGEFGKITARAGNGASDAARRGILTILSPSIRTASGGIMSLRTNKLRQVLFGAALGVATLGVCAVSQAEAQDAKAEQPAKKASILVEKGLLKDPEAMMRTAFLAEIDEARAAWVAEYEKVETPADVEAYQKKKR